MKILVVYATAGAGHRRAAEAVDQYLQTLPNCTSVLHDSLNDTSPPYKFLYGWTYTFMITHIPWLWAFLFALLDVPFLQPIIRLLRRFQNIIHGWPLQRHMVRENYDAIISTHFFPNEVAAYLKRHGRITSKIISVITDYDVHRIWLAKGVDHYTCATELTAQKCRDLGLNKNQIHVTGIPIDGKFGAVIKEKDIRSRLNLKSDMFTVLIATGSFGIGPIEEIVEQLGGIQVMVVCGHNEALYQRMKGASGPDVHVFGLVSNMHDLMAAADAMITKPGGLSVSEGLVCGLPMIFFNAIPGQEMGNVRALKHYGVGESGLSIEQMAEQMHGYADDRSKLEEIRSKARALGKPDAARRISELLYL